MPSMASYQRNAPSIPFKVVSGDPVPPFAALEIVSVVDDVWVMRAPSTDNAPQVYFNGASAVPVNAIGEAYFHPLGVAAYYELEGAPSVNLEIGPAANSYYLKRSKRGFHVAGAASNGAVLVSRGFSAPSIPTPLFELSSQPVSIDCTDSGDFKFTFAYTIRNGTGVAVSGTVFGADGKGQPDIAVYGSTQAINSPLYVDQIALTDAQGQYSGVVRPYVTVGDDGRPAIVIRVAASATAANYDPGPFIDVVSSGASPVTVNFQRQS
jgi:hypothetical protein